jgi:hypothetical protein
MLEKAGVTTSQGSRTWTKASVYNLLRSRAYLGEVAYGHDRRYVNPDAHEAIIDAATWAAAQRSPIKGLVKQRTDNDSFLVGLIRCRACGYAMQATRTSHGRRIYRCNRTHAGGVCPEPARLDAERVEAEAEGLLRSHTEAMRVLGKAGKQQIDLGPPRKELELLEQRLQQAESAEAQDAFGERWLTVVKERREARDAKLAELGAMEAEQRAKPSATADSVMALWHGAQPTVRRELLASIFDLFAAGRDGSLVPFPRGTGPADLPTRGYKKEPRLSPIEVTTTTRASTRKAARRRPKTRP